MTFWATVGIFFVLLMLLAAGAAAGYFMGYNFALLEMAEEDNEALRKALKEGLDDGGGQ